MNRFTRTARRLRVSDRAAGVFLVTLILVLTACRDAAEVAYRIPKEKVPTPADRAAASAPAPEVTVAARPVSELTWSAPAAWKAKPASSMRRGSFDVGEETGAPADLAITAFPGNVGGDLANVNRWRGQLELPPITDAALPLALETVPAASGLSIRVVDLAGGPADNPQRMLGAIVPYAGATWFFKLTGPATVVAAEKARFLEFLATVAPASAKAPDMVAAAAPPPGVVAASAAVPDLRWTVPAHWQTKPATALRKATFLIPGDGGAFAELAVSTFPGDVGGELANVNRWRGQLQLPPLDAAALAGNVTRFTVHDLAVTLVEFTGAGPGGPQRLVGAIVPCAGATWFFKLIGPEAVVAAGKPEFLSFLQTLSAP